MKCPIDDTVLQMTDRQGVEIDYCPQCRGVWLDRGEVDKLIERAAVETPAPPRAQAAPTSYDRRRDFDDDDDDRRRRSSDDRRDSHYSSKRKKESFLGSVFDF